MENQIDAMISMLDSMVEEDISRIKVTVSKEVDEGVVKKEYHHGRCDVGSPWAKGCSFDVLE